MVEGGIVYPETETYLKQLIYILKDNGISVELELLNELDHFLFEVYSKSYLEGALYD